MKFKEALKKLGIEEYGERIFSSNSHGEVFHCMDYINIAESLKEPAWFKYWFDSIVKYAEEKWDRPESVFQHIPTILEQYENEKKAQTKGE